MHLTYVWERVCGEVHRLCTTKNACLFFPIFLSYIYVRECWSFLASLYYDLVSRCIWPEMNGGELVIFPLLRGFALSPRETRGCIPPPVAVANLLQRYQPEIDAAGAVS
jgi:hypothetical protein